MNCSTRLLGSIWMCLLLAAAPASGQDASPYPFGLPSEGAVDQVEQGREQLLNMEFQAADATFERVAGLSGGAAAGHYHLALLRMLEALFTESERSYDRFYEQSDRLESALDTVPEGAWRALLTGEWALQRAFVHAKRENPTNAALAARRAYQAYANSLSYDSDFYEAYKGIGLLHLAIGGTPRSYRRVLSVLGYDGTITEGLRELRVAAERSTYNDLHAGIISSWASIALDVAPEESLERMRALAAAHPQSPLMQYFYGFTLLTQRHAARAEQVLRHAAQISTAPDRFYIDYIDFYLAEALLRQQEYENALSYYRRFLDRHDGTSLRAPALAHAGLALEMMDRREDAVSYYRRALQEEETERNQPAQRLADEHLDQPLTPLERRLATGRFLYDAGANNEAETVLQAVLDAEETTRALQAEAAYRLGRLYQSEEAYDRAMHFYRFSMTHQDDSEERWAPWSQYYIGQIYERTGRGQQAREAYQAALNYEGDYNYSRGLGQRVQAAFERLDAVE